MAIKTNAFAHKRFTDSTLASHRPTLFSFGYNVRALIVPAINVSMTIKILLLAIVIVASPWANANEEESGDNDESSTQTSSLCDGNTDDGCPYSSPSPDASNNGFSPSTLVGNPISLVTGNKYQLERDYYINGTTLEFSRHYNSGNVLQNTGAGQGWSTTFGTRLVKLSGGGFVLYESTGKTIRFDNVHESETGLVSYHTNASNNGFMKTLNEFITLWELPDGRAITFKGSLLAHIEFPGHQSLTMKYRHGRIVEVIDEAERRMLFDYTPDEDYLPEFKEGQFREMAGHLRQITLPDGKRIGYDYDGNFNLTRVRFDDGSSKQYHYENPDYPNHLTGITDRLGNRFATWSYNESGQAITSEHGNGIEKVSLAYSMPENESDSGYTQVLNSNGALTTYEWQHIKERGQILLLSSDGPGCSTCPAGNRRYRYNKDYRLESLSTTAGEERRLLYDDEGRIARVERVDLQTDETTVIVRYEYDEGQARPSLIFRPSVNPTEEYSIETIYNDERLPIAITEVGYAPSSIAGSISGNNLYEPITRTTKYHYEAGLLTKLDGPRIDVDDITTFEYDQLGRMTQMNLPSGESTRISEYDEHGRATVFRQGDSSPTMLQYDSYGNISAITQNGLAIKYQYNAENLLVSLKTSSGKVTLLHYDESQRLSHVTDDLGRTTELTFNTESQLVNRTAYGVNGELIKSLRFVYDAQSRLQSATEDRSLLGAAGTISKTLELEYDEFDRLNRIREQKSGASRQLVFNELGRLLSTAERNGLSETQAFDVHNRLSSKTDKQLNTTHYHRDDFGQIRFLQSPETGITAYTYDSAGNRITKVNANGEKLNYVWDNANRLLKRSGPDGDIEYRYHASNGQLVETVYPGGSEQFKYTPTAQLRSHSRIIDNHTFTTEYAYSANGKLSSKSLPDGQILRYHYYESGPSSGTLRAITKDSLFGLRQMTIVGEIDLDYRDGQSSFLSHNGKRNEYVYHASGEISSISVVDSLKLDYQYNDNGQIIGISRGLVDDDQNTFIFEDETYHYNNRQLSGAKTDAGEFSYQYDYAGNRTSAHEKLGESENRITMTYSPAGQGNVLDKIVDAISGEELDVQHNAAGSPLLRGELRYEYNSDQRPVTVYRNNVKIAEYSYNSFGERVKKVSYSHNQKKVTYFLYDNRKLTAEIDGGTLAYRQTVYLKNSPVAHFIDDKLYAVHTDHIGTPSLLTDDKGATVWKANYTPLGKANIRAETVNFQLRYPGQYADTETGTHYNYLRDYDPATGRYLTSDPIGLNGGLNTYAYANNDTLKNFDVLGLSPTSPNLPSTLINPFSVVTANTAIDVPNPSANIPEITDQDIADTDEIIAGFRTGGGGCTPESIREFNDAVNDEFNSSFDTTVAYLNPNLIDEIQDLSSNGANGPIMAGFEELEVNEHSHLLVFAECTSDEDIRAGVQEALGPLVRDEDLDGLIRSLNSPREDGCRDAQLVDLTELHAEILNRFQVKLNTDPAVLAAERRLILAQQAMDEFELANPGHPCRYDDESNTYAGPASDRCTTFYQLHNALRDASKELAETLEATYDAIKEEFLPPYDLAEENDARREQILLAAIGIIIPLTATDLAIEAIGFGIGKIGRIFSGAADFITALRAGNYASRFADALTDVSKSIGRVEELKLAQYDNYPAIQNMSYADVVRIENSVGADKLAKLDEAMAGSPELSSAISADPSLANAWRILDDAADAATCSFDGSMEVPTLRGHIAIKDIKVGRDYVFAKDEVTGLTNYKLVTALYSNEYDKQVFITSVNDQTGEIQTVISNEIHPVFTVPTSSSFAGATIAESSEGHTYDGNISGGRWVDAVNLTVGSKLLNSTSGFSTLLSVETVNNNLQAFNLTVADYHTYFISAPASNTAYWVHNSCFNHGLVKNDPEALARLNDDVRSTPGLEDALTDDPALVEQWNKLADFPDARTDQNTLNMMKEFDESLPVTDVGPAASRGAATDINGNELRSDHTFYNLDDPSLSLRDTNQNNLGIVKDNSTGTFEIDSPGTYMDVVRDQYAANGPGLHPDLDALIEQYVSRPGAKYNTIDGPPGTHSEIQALNQLIHDAGGIDNLGSVNIATRYPDSGNNFDACDNCGGILGLLDVVTIITD